MSHKQEQREFKEAKIRPLKQEIENIKLDLMLKLDLMDAQDEYNNMYNNLMKCTQLLEESINFTKGKLKYDSQKLTQLLNKMYKF